MNKPVLILYLLAAVLCGYSQPVRIACVGNSITYCASVENRVKNTYPLQLQVMPGSIFAGTFQTSA